MVDSKGGGVLDLIITDIKNTSGVLFNNFMRIKQLLAFVNPMFTDEQVIDYYNLPATPVLAPRYKASERKFRANGFIFLRVELLRLLMLSMIEFVELASRLSEDLRENVKQFKNEFGATSVFFENKQTQFNTTHLALLTSYIPKAKGHLHNLKQIIDGVHTTNMPELYKIVENIQDIAEAFELLTKSKSYDELPYDEIAIHTLIHPKNQHGNKDNNNT